MNLDRLAHHNVLVRLGVSAIHGIGVFAGQTITAGSVVFANDMRSVRWASEAEVRASAPTPFQQGLYDDFAVRRGGQLGTPDSFDLLTVGWYVNEPITGSQPNLHADDDLRFVATRDICEGEELTIVYEKFSDQI